MEKPNFDDYFTSTGQKYPGAMKRFIIDSLKFLQESGNEDALEIPIEMLENELDEELVADDPSKLPPLSRMLMIKLIRSSFAAEIFDQMLDKVGSSMADIRRLHEEGSFRQMPGMPYATTSEALTEDEMRERMYNMLKHEVHQKIAPALVKAGTTGNVDYLVEQSEKLKDAAKEALRIVGGTEDDESAVEIQQLLDYNEVFIRMVDQEQTTQEHFSRFMNTLLNEFIDTRVDKLNREVHNHEHKDHDADDCVFADPEVQNFEAPLMHCLWRRYYGMGEFESETPEIEKLQDVSTIIFDAFNNTIEFIGLTFHPALEHVITERMNEKIPGNDALREEVFQLFTKYVKNNPEIMRALERQHEGDDKMAIMVSMDVACPTLEVLDKCYISSQSESDESISESDLDAALAELLKADQE